MGLWKSISGFGNQFRPQEVDGHLVIDFGPQGVNFGLYRILQMICLENLMREFTNENLCLSRGIWVNFLCLLSEYLSKINPINESNISHRESILGFLKSNFGFWDSILSICKAILGISELLLSLWESVLGLWESIFRPLGVVYFCLWGLVLGFWESILSLWGGFWDSLCSDFEDLGAHFGTLGVILALKRKCMY